LTRRESITLVAWGGDRPASYGAAQQRMPLVGLLEQRLARHLSLQCWLVFERAWWKPALSRAQIWSS